MVKLRLACVYLSFFFVSIIFFIVYIFGVLRYLSDVEENTCDMTYMFEYPQYVRIKLDDKIEENCPKYGLYAYGEGFVTDKLRKMQFTGIPVLFIPGNAGSHEQVRSLASVSLRMSLKRHTPFHFDFFTVDLAEGYSALYGGILGKQTGFVRECIHKILSLYKGKMEKVVLIGHSMGGIVAKAALLHDNPSRESLASILITLATPHTPQLALDRKLSNYYHHVNEKALELQEMETTIISIGGGTRDIMVTSNQIIDPHAHLNVLATAVPHSWKSLDHLSILWCKQFVLVLVRALFDSVDVNNRIPNIHKSPQMRLRAFNYHLTSKFSGKYLDNYEEKMTFDKNGEWIQISKPQFTFEASRHESVKEKKKDSSIFLMIPINQKYSHVSIDAIDLETRDWLFLCSQSSQKTCQSGLNISNGTKLLPTNKNDLRKSVNFNLEQFRLNSEFTNIVVKIPKKSSESPIIHVDSYFEESRTLRIEDTTFFWFSKILSTILPSNKIIIFKSDEGSLRYFVGLEGIRDVVSVELRTILPRKYEENDQNFEHGVIEVIEEENSRNSSQIFFRQIHFFSTKDLNRRTSFRIQTSGSAAMRITVNPAYSYEVRISQAGILDRLSIFVRDRWVRLYHVLLSFCLLIISARLDQESRRTGATILITIIGIFLLGLDLEGIIALGFLHVFALSTCAVVVFFGSVVHNLAARFVTRVVALFPVIWSDWLLREGLQIHVPILSNFAAISLIATSCGALAMVISVVIYLLKLIHMYEDYLEELLMASFRSITRRFDKFFEKRRKNRRDRRDDEDPRGNILNHLSIFMLWTLGTLPAVPTVLVWAKTYSHESRLFTEDPLMLSAWIVLTSLGSLGLVKIPLTHTNTYVELIGVNFQRILGWSVLLTAGSKDPYVYQWTIPLVVAASVSCISSASLFLRLSRKSDDSQAEILDEDESPSRKVKTN